MSNDSLPEVPVARLPIRLGQFLKLVAIAEGGGEAAALIAAGLVTVNGDVENRRGRKLVAGDEVAIGDERWRLTAEGGEGEEGA
jgi:ribosome-associated protein